jgi:hypothetical protein
LCPVKRLLGVPRIEFACAPRKRRRAKGSPMISADRPDDGRTRWKDSSFCTLRRSISGLARRSLSHPLSGSPAPIGRSNPRNGGALKACMSTIPFERALAKLDEAVAVLEVNAPGSSVLASLKHWRRVFGTALEDAALVHEWLSVADVAAMSGKAESTVRWRLDRKKQDGMLPNSSKRGREWVIHRDDLDALWAA